MKLNFKLAILVIFLIVPVLAFGQGSGSSDASRASGGSMAKKSNFAINRSVSGIVSFISSSSIQIKTGSGKNSVFSIKRNTNFIGGRPRQGERAKITYLAQNKQAISIRRS